MKVMFTFLYLGKWVVVSRPFAYLNNTANVCTTTFGLAMSLVGITESRRFQIPK